jgi:hypothetical protein
MMMMMMMMMMMSPSSTTMPSRCRSALMIARAPPLPSTRCRTGRVRRANLPTIIAHSCALLARPANPYQGVAGHAGILDVVVAVVTTGAQHLRANMLKNLWVEEQLARTVCYVSDTKDERLAVRVEHYGNRQEVSMDMLVASHCPTGVSDDVRGHYPRRAPGAHRTFSAQSFLCKVKAFYQQALAAYPQREWFVVVSDNAMVRLPRLVRCLCVFAHASSR